MLYYTIALNDSLNIVNNKDLPVSFTSREALSRNIKAADGTVTFDLTKIGAVKSVYIETTLSMTVTINGQAITVTKTLFLEGVITSLTFACSDATTGANMKAIVWGV